MATTYTFTLRDGVTLSDATFNYGGTRYDVDDMLTDGEGEIETQNEGLASALRSLRAGSVPLLDEASVASPEEPDQRRPLPLYGQADEPTPQTGWAQFVTNDGVLTGEVRVDLGDGEPSQVLPVASAGEAGMSAAVKSALASLPAKTATKLTDVSVSASSTSITSAGSGFTSDMDGQFFYLVAGGNQRVTGTYAWQAEPLVGTFTYVSASTGTLSVAAETTVSSGTIVIGPDATTAINNALQAGVCRLPDIPFVVAGQIFTTADDQYLYGASRRRSGLYSVTRRANGPASAFHRNTVFANLAWHGNGWGSQPLDPYVSVAAGDHEALYDALADAGCGFTFANVTEGRMDVVAYHCGGEGLTEFSAANSGDVFTLTNHAFSNGDQVSFRTLSSESAGVSLDTTYYIINRTANTFQVSLTQGGGAVTLSADITGTMGGETHNGIAGIYSTMGNVACEFKGAAYYSRGGVNEDNFFNGADPDGYLPRGNVYDAIRAWYCRYGYGMEPGRTYDGSVGPRGFMIRNGDARYCILPGIEVHGAWGFHIDGFYAEGNQYGVSIRGSHEEKRSTGGTAKGLKLIGNVEHGLRLGQFTDNNTIEAYCAYNGYSGLALSGAASAASRPKDNDVTVTVRQNNQTGTSPEVDLSYATRNNITVKQDVMPGEFDVDGTTPLTPTPLATYIVREQNSSDENVITDESRITSAGTSGMTLLIGASSRNGSLHKRSRVRMAGENLRGEAFPRLEAVGATAPAGGDARATLTGFLAGDKVTVLYCQTTATATTVTNAFLCLWSKTGVLLGVTADMAATFNGGSGVLGANLTTAYEFTTDTAAYIGFTFVGGTPPTMLRANTNSCGQVASGLVPHIAMTGQSAVPDPHDLSAASTAYWFGWR